MSAIALGAAAFTSGALSALGPCTAPRVMALAALSGTEGRTRRLAAPAFVAGLVVSYAVLGTIAASTLRSLAASHWTYWALAVASLCAAVRVIGRNPVAAGCGHAHSATLGAAFVAGLCAAATGLGCCAPIAILLAHAVSSGGTLVIAMTLACFALGQSMLIFVVAAGWSTAATFVNGAAASMAAATVSGGVLFALGAYYALLA